VYKVAVYDKNGVIFEQIWRFYICNVT